MAYFSKNLEGTVNIVDIADSLGIKSSYTQELGNCPYPKFQLIEINKFITDAAYQRLVSKNTIRKAKAFDPSLCQPVYATQRPDGSIYCVDGQHRLLLALTYVGDPEHKIPTFLYTHPSNLSVEDCQKVEAGLFHKLNSSRKNTSQVERLRAGITYGEEEAKKQEKNLIELGLQVEGIGSPEGYPVKSYGRLLTSVKRYGLVHTTDAVRLLVPLYVNSWKYSEIDGAYVLGMAALLSFITKVSGGVGGTHNGVKGLKQFLNKHLVKLDPKRHYILKGISGVNPDVTIARRIIDRYNAAVVEGEVTGYQFAEDYLRKNGLVAD
jgi:hypothetical protein